MTIFDVVALILADFSKIDSLKTKWWPATIAYFDTLRGGQLPLPLPCRVRILGLPWLGLRSS